MAVRFRNWSQIGGSAAPVTDFSDSFNRADTVFGLGPNYIGSERTPLQSSVAAVPSARIGSGQMIMLSNGGGLGSQIPGTVYFVVPLLNSAVYGKSQYCQLVYSSSGGGGDVAGGPGLMFTGNFVDNNQNGYYLDTASGTARIRRYDTTATTLATVAYIPASLDLIRMEVVCGPAQNTITALVNGVVLATAVDAAGPLLTGYPVLWLPANVPANTRTWNSLRMGII